MRRRRRYTAGSASLRSCGRGWYLDDGEEQAELANGVGEAFVIHRLGDVDVATELIATLYFTRIVGGGQHHDRRRSQIFVVLDPLQDIDACHVGQIVIEQDQERLAPVTEARSILAEQIAQRGCTAGERDNLIVDTGSANVPLDQAGMALIVPDYDDCDWN